MKKLLLFAVFIVLTLIFCTDANAQTIDWDAVKQRYVEKYQPQKMPVWLFPMIFEEGTGQRDTVYFGFHPDASRFDVNPEFGERREYADSFEFQLVLKDPVWWSGFKVSIKPYQGDFFYTDIYCRQCYMPYKIYWNKLDFYSDSLPFPYQKPLPIGQGELEFGSSYMDKEACSFHFRILMSDTFKYGPGGWCREADSIIFTTSHSGLAGNLTLLIAPYKGYSYVGVNAEKEKTFDIYPNPVSDYLLINVVEDTPFDITLYNVYGQKIYYRPCYSGDQTISFSSYPPGIYFLLLQTEQGSITKKIIKLI
jgi:hypothetical protein